jgi:hypothetical protein
MPEGSKTMGMVVKVSFRRDLKVRAKVSPLRVSTPSGAGLVSFFMMARGEDQVLLPVSGSCSQIVAYIQTRTSIGAHSLGAINITELGVTDTSADLPRVPGVKSKFLGVGLEATVVVIVPGGSKGHVLNVLASTVT